MFCVNIVCTQNNWIMIGLSINPMIAFHNTFYLEHDGSWKYLGRLVVNGWLLKTTSSVSDLSVTKRSWQCSELKIIDFCRPVLVLKMTATKKTPLMIILIGFLKPSNVQANIQGQVCTNVRYETPPIFQIHILTPDNSHEFMGIIPYFAT